MKLKNRFKPAFQEIHHKKYGKLAHSSDHLLLRKKRVNRSNIQEDLLFMQAGTGCVANVRDRRYKSFSSY